VIFLLGCVCPVAWMMLGTPGSTGIAAVVSGLAELRQRALIANTVAVGFGVMGFSCTIGVPLGISLSRCDFRRVRLARVFLIVPLVLPSYVLTLAWILLFGRPLGTWAYSLPAVIVVLGFSLYPIVMLTTEAALRNVPSRLEEAGRLVASPIRVWFRILFPLIGSALVASLLVIFVLAISDFAVPSMLRVRVYTTEVFTAFASLYDFRLATVMALPLATVAALASLASLELARRPFVARAERGQLGARWNEAQQRVAALVLGVVAIGAVATPVGAIAWEARAGRSSFGDAVSLDAIRNSVWWSVAAASIVVAIGTLLAYWRAKATPRVGHAAESIWVVLFAVPATIAGIGVIGLWNRPGILGAIYRTDAIVIIAYVSRFLPIGALLCASFLRRVTMGVEEAAILAGASWRRAFTRIVLPLSSKGLAAVWLVVFILMLGDIALALLVAPPGESTLAVRAYTLMANSPISDVARLAVMQSALSALPLAAVAWLAQQRFQNAR
jgi:iron(III) transport system permease protein